jgi:hypothetical protein
VVEWEVSKVDSQYRACGPTHLPVDPKVEVDASMFEPVDPSEETILSREMK